MFKLLLKCLLFPTLCYKIPVELHLNKLLIIVDAILCLSHINTYYMKYQNLKL